MERRKTLQTDLDTAPLKAEFSPIIARAQSLIVTNPDEAQAAFDLRGVCKSFEKKVKDFFAPHKKRADEAHAALCASEKKELEPAREAVAILDKKLSTYQEDERRKAEEAQKEAEARARNDAEDKALAEAQAAEEAGDHETAAAVLAEPVAVPAVKVASPPKLSGGSFRTTYYGTVTDKAAFLKYAAVSPGVHSLIEIPQSALNRYAAATKGAMKIPGLSFGDKQVPVGR